MTIGISSTEPPGQPAASAGMPNRSSGAGVTDARFLGVALVGLRLAAMRDASARERRWHGDHRGGDRRYVLSLIHAGARRQEERSASLSGVDEMELFVGVPVGRSSDRDRTVIDLGLVERLHELVVRPVPERLVFVMDGSCILGRV